MYVIKRNEVLIDAKPDIYEIYSIVDNDRETRGYHLERREVVVTLYW